MRLYHLVPADSSFCVVKKMEQGWIKLHRKMLDWEWYKDDKVFRVFLHLLLNVNHEEKKWKGIMIKSGQKITSYGHLARELNLGVQSVRTALDRLKSTDEITIKTTNKYTMITILKWKDYQQPTSKLTINQQSTNNQLTTNKNVKNEKIRENASLNYLKEIPDTDLEEMYNRFDCDKRAISGKAESLYLYCQSKGRVYKNYHALLLNALKKDFPERKEPIKSKKVVMIDGKPTIIQ